MANNLRPGGAEAGSVGQPLRPIRPPRSEPRPDLQEALAVLRQGKWSIPVITLLVVGVALFVSSRQTPVYESEARVLVLPVDVLGNPNLATEAELMSSVAVAEIVAEKLGIQGDPRELLGDLSVDWPTDTEILKVSYRHLDPAEAQRRAQGFADGYLQYRRGAVTEELLESAEAFQAELRVLRERLNEIERTLVRIAEDDPRRNTLESEAGVVQSLILQRQLEQVGLQESVTVGRLVQPAPLSSSPVSPNHVVNGGFGLVAGLALGIGLAFLRDRLSGRLRSPEEVEEHLGASVLGSIPRVPAWRKRKEAFLVTLNHWQSPAAETYRILRTNVLSAASAYGAKSIVVTSAHSGEGKSATVANMGVVLAGAGKRVSLVSADLRRPRLHEFFRLNGRLGLTDVLAGRVPLDDALLEITRATFPRTGDATAVNLRILPSGRVPQDPAELLTSETMSRVLRDLEETSDIVLIDVPPILPVTDALVLASVANSVLLVIGPRNVTRPSVMAARQQLDKVGAHILGAVLNGPDAFMGRAHYTYY